MNAKINILYARLSREDMESNGESGSITNQIELLTKYSENNGFTPILPIQDDGWSGTSWSRPGWQELMGYVERGEVATILVKTLDRIGRDHLRVGLLLEQFQEQGIRLIAPGDNIDTAQGVDDFVPLRTLLRNGTPATRAAKSEQSTTPEPARADTSQAQYLTASCVTPATAKRGSLTKKPRRLSDGFIK